MTNFNPIRRSPIKGRIKIGDIVRLKSGGPKMTVTKIGNEFQGYVGKDSVACDWFVRGEHHEQTFPIESLTRTK